MEKPRHSAFLSHYGWVLTGALVSALAFAPTSAQATQLELIYNGVFNTQNALNPASQSNPTYFSTATLADYVLAPARVDKGFGTIRDYLNYNGVTTVGGYEHRRGELGFGGRRIEKHF